MGIQYGELARKAEEQAKGLEEPFRSIAFRTVLEDLIAQARDRDPIARTLVQGPVSEPKADPVDRFLKNVVDDSEYSGILSSRGRLCDKSLAVLKVAKDQLKIDGLTAAQIAKVLTLKFRVAGVQAGHVARDLGSAPGYVQVVGAGREKRFLLMTPGERHLEGIRTTSTE